MHVLGRGDVPMLQLSKGHNLLDAAVVQHTRSHFVVLHLLQSKLLSLAWDQRTLHWK